MIEESPLEPSLVVMGDGELAGAGRGDLGGDAQGHGLGDQVRSTGEAGKPACLLGVFAPATLSHRTRLRGIKGRGGPQGSQSLRVELLRSPGRATGQLPDTGSGKMTGP